MAGADSLFITAPSTPGSPPSSTAAGGDGSNGSDSPTTRTTTGSGSGSGSPSNSSACGGGSPPLGAKRRLTAETEDAACKTPMTSLLLGGVPEPLGSPSTAMAPVLRHMPQLPEDCEGDALRQHLHHLHLQQHHLQQQQQLFQQQQHAHHQQAWHQQHHQQRHQHQVQQQNPIQQQQQQIIHQMQVHSSAGIENDASKAQVMAVSPRAAPPCNTDGDGDGNGDAYGDEMDAADDDEHDACDFAVDEDEDGKCSEGEGVEFDGAHVDGALPVADAVPVATSAEAAIATTSTMVAAATSAVSASASASGSGSGSPAASSAPSSLPAGRASPPLLSHAAHGDGTNPAPTATHPAATNAAPATSTAAASGEANNALQGMALVQAELVAQVLPHVGDYAVDVQAKLGHGAFSCVFRGQHVETVEAVAVKAISLQSLNLQGYQEELRITQLAQGHPGIVRFLEELVSPRVAYLVFELCEFGEVFDHIQPNLGLPRDRLAPYFSQLIEAVSFLHTRGICHLDIKTENMLIDSNGRLKLCDFGMSTLIEDGPIYNCRGSIGYAAPENLRCHFQEKSGRAVTGYDGQRADMWSCGVVLFVFMFGQTPWDFARESAPEYRLYKHTEGYPCLAPWDGMNRTIRALFHGLLAVHPSRRWEAPALKGFLARELGWRYTTYTSRPAPMPSGSGSAAGGSGM